MKRIDGRYESSATDYRLWAREADTISKEEEQELLRRVPEKEAMSALVQKHILLIAQIARSYVSAENSYDDLMSEGVMGFMEGIRKYSPEYGTCLSTYAAYYVKKYILAYINNQKPFCVSALMTENLRKVKKVLSTIDMDERDRVSAKDIAELSGLNERQVLEALYLEKDVKVSYLNAVRTEDNTTEFHEFVPDRKYAPEDMCIRDCVDGNIEELLRTLSGEEYRLVALRFGLEDGIERGLRETADILNWSVDDVRIREKQVIRKLKAAGHKKEDYFC